ncbi:MAG TPA: hypothetical protein VFF39_02115 [Verrucomicrobiae bacterium]|nr:hypothetical protein [Verrucomicrobiae bacterium]
MKIFTRILFALALTSTLLAQQPAKDTADQPAKDQQPKVLAGREGMTENFFKLAFVMYELNDGKRINQRDYMMIGRTDNQPSSIRVSTRVPITTAEKGGDKQYTYTDVGLRINCSMKEQVDRRLQLHCDIEISSFISPEQIANATGNAGPAAPFLRSTRTESWALLTLGKPANLTTVDDVNSAKRLQVEITATRLD